MSQNYVKLKSRLIRAARKLIRAFSEGEYVKVAVKWSKHEELGRCSVDIQRRVITFTFRIPLKGMTTEDLAVSCVEAITSTARRVLVGGAMIAFLAAAAVWYVVPSEVSESTRVALSLAIAALAICMMMAAGVSIFKHERELRRIKEEYVQVAKSDVLSLRAYSFLVDVIAWLLKECRGKNKVIIRASKVMGFIRSQYGDLLKELSPTE